MIAQTPEPPYYAVIFTSIKQHSAPGYADTAALMLTLAQEQDGFLGVESASAALGITVSYWRNKAAIRRWKLQTDHQIAQQRGREAWYAQYQVRIAKVERAYGFENPASAPDDHV